MLDSSSGILDYILVSHRVWNGILLDGIGSCHFGFVLVSVPLHIFLGPPNHNVLAFSYMSSGVDSGAATDAAAQLRPSHVCLSFYPAAPRVAATTVP